MMMTPQPFKSVAMKKPLFLKKREAKLEEKAMLEKEKAESGIYIQRDRDRGRERDRRKPCLRRKRLKAVCMYVCMYVYVER